MLISDWSSDVCSSYLYGSGGIVASFAEAARNSWDQAQQGELDKAAVKSVLTVAGYATGIPAAQTKKTLDAIEAARDGEDVSVLDYLPGPQRAGPRSEERRVGKVWGRTCRFRWAPD